MQLYYVALLTILEYTYATRTFDCHSGFVGRISLNRTREDFKDVRERRMCVAEYCVQVIIHKTIDRRGSIRQGISTRCAYTGGDRDSCRRKNCTELGIYEGMRGKFRFCCCKGNGCNRVTRRQIEELYMEDDTPSITFWKTTATPTPSEQSLSKFNPVLVCLVIVLTVIT